MSRILYFAYGSNMNRAQMARRCPSARPLGRARLAEHAFRITSDGVANVVPAPGRHVLGVLWSCAASDMAALDVFEGVAEGWYRRAWLPVAAGTGAHHAVVYVGRTIAPGAPRPGYLDLTVIPGAREFGLPEWYLAQLSRWLVVRSGRPAPAEPAITRTGFVEVWGR
jgi:gamma-glutamylcyclotransferase (GGCT)/AIG2-like uncharacterized protein YtfP